MTPKEIESLIEEFRVVLTWLADRIEGLEKQIGVQKADNNRFLRTWVRLERNDLEAQRDRDILKKN